MLSRASLYLKTKMLTQKPGRESTTPPKQESRSPQQAGINGTSAKKKTKGVKTTNHRQISIILNLETEKKLEAESRRSQSKHSKMSSEKNSGRGGKSKKKNKERKAPLRRRAAELGPCVSIEPRY